MKIIISIALVGMGFTGTAQQEKKEHIIPMFTHSIGASFQQFDGLNGRVAGLPQYQQLKGHTATLGLGWLKECKRVISGAGLTLGSSMSGDRDERSSTIRYYGLNADVGYDVLKSERVMLFPLAGLGFQKYQAIFFKDNSAVDFDEVLESSTTQNNIQSVRFHNSFLVYRLGFGVSLSSPKHAGHSIGLQAGYSGSFKKNKWRSNENQSLANAPQDEIGQFFVSLVFANKPMFKR
ncbi:MAG: hypothetical protein WKI04_02255 [Ferruginibacter sp.]